MGISAPRSTSGTRYPRSFAGQNTTGRRGAVSMESAKRFSPLHAVVRLARGFSCSTIPQPCQLAGHWLHNSYLHSTSRCLKLLRYRFFALTPQWIWTNAPSGRRCSLCVLQAPRSRHSKPCYFYINSLQYPLREKTRCKRTLPRLDYSVQTWDGRWATKRQPDLAFHF